VWRPTANSKAPPEDPALAALLAEVGLERFAGPLREEVGAAVVEDLQLVTEADMVSKIWFGCIVALHYTSSTLCSSGAKYV
jgi:hypothetical protein